MIAEIWLVPFYADCVNEVVSLLHPLLQFGDILPRRIEVCYLLCALSAGTLSGSLLNEDT